MALPSTTARARAGSGARLAAAGPGSFFALSFSSLTRRILSLNLAAWSRWCEHPLSLAIPRRPDRRAAQSLLVQAEIIAGAIAASATVDTNTSPSIPTGLRRSEAR